MSRSEGRQASRAVAGWALVVVLLPLVLVSCNRAYYAAWEKLGKHKRDLLRDHVAAARDEQAAAQEQFVDALTRLKDLYGYDGGDLEKIYDRMKRDLDRSESRAEAVRDRIETVATTASDLFQEWEGEIDQLSSPKLRATSRSKLDQTRARYRKLERAMGRAESSMEPVLVQFRDQVLFLKHNLNAHAVGSLQGEVGQIETDVSELIAEMRVAIDEAASFLRELPE